MYRFSSRMSYGKFALNKYFISLTTFVVVSMSPKFSILTSLPISVEWRASKAVILALCAVGRHFVPVGGDFVAVRGNILKSSGFCSANFSAKSGMYTSPMQPIIASHWSCCRLKIFWAM